MTEHGSGQEATEPNKSRRRKDLTVQQSNAIDLLVLGQTDTATAAGVGVCRQTIWEWKQRHPEFKAALNQRRRDIWQSQRARLRALVEPAVNVLEEELDGARRLQTAIHVLKTVGVYGAVDPPEGATDPDEIRFQLRCEEDERLERRASDEERLAQASFHRTAYRSLDPL